MRLPEVYVKGNNVRSHPLQHAPPEFLATQQLTLSGASPDQIPPRPRRNNRPGHRAAEESARRRLPWRSWRPRPPVKRRSRRPRRRRQGTRRSWRRQRRPWKGAWPVEKDAMAAAATATATTTTTKCIECWRKREDSGIGMIKAVAATNAIMYECHTRAG